ncbi:MAG TPA: type II secretion system protein N [Burkholderiaceae bacterium]|nr:type II secretion system protein N [Burkholderiaceae bacterium]
MELRWPGWLRRRSGASRLSRLNPSAFQNSTLAELAWQRARHASTRWAVWGAVVGTLAGVLAFAPASWLASALASATDQRLLLADARGTIWSGNAQLLLTGGAGSRDAAALPGRMHWQIRPRLNGIELAINQACCIDREWIIQFRLVGLGRYQVVLPARPQALGHWPAAWLAGLGTPFNTLQLGGTLQLTSNGMTLEPVQGRWRVIGSIDADLLGVSSRLSTLDTLGSYRFSVRGGATSNDPALLNLETLEGALRLSGSGQWTGFRGRFRGEASAADGQEAALNNLLNIIGRRQGATSVISIG